MDYGGRLPRDYSAAVITAAQYGYLLASRAGKSVDFGTQDWYTRFQRATIKPLILLMF